MTFSHGDFHIPRYITISIAFETSLFIGHMFCLSSPMPLIDWAIQINYFLTCVSQEKGHTSTLSKGKCSFVPINFQLPRMHNPTQTTTPFLILVLPNNGVSRCVVFLLTTYSAQVSIHSIFNWVRHGFHIKNLRMILFKILKSLFDYLCV